LSGLNNMTSKRGKVKNRAANGQFQTIPRQVVESGNYSKLDGWSVKLLVDINAQFNGKNNGDLCATWSLLKDKGWRSKATLHRSTRNLIELGFIQQTRQGGRNQCSLFSVTFKPIDECQGKLDTKPTITPSNLWKLTDKDTTLSIVKVAK